MGIFSNMDNKKRYCVFCGKELSDGKCTACGREAKEVVSLSSLNWQKVPMEVADALGEQKKQLFGNPFVHRKGNDHKRGSFYRRYSF